MSVQVLQLFTSVDYSDTSNNVKFASEVGLITSKGIQPTLTCSAGEEDPVLLSSDYHCLLK